RFKEERKLAQEKQLEAADARFKEERKLDREKQLDAAAAADARFKAQLDAADARFEAAQERFKEDRKLDREMHREQRERDRTVFCAQRERDRNAWVQLQSDHYGTFSQRMKSLLDTHNEDRAALVAHVEQLRPLIKPKRLLLTKLDKDSKCQITAGTAPYVKRQERKLTYTRNQEYSASMGVSDPKKIKSEIVSTGGERLKRALSEDSEAMVRTKIKGVLCDITFEEEHILFYGEGHDSYIGSHHYLVNEVKVMMKKEIVLDDSWLLHLDL
ncbi:hypothetical protein BBJ28_00026799, partial [Nothophytophthora sp. Chile5]